MNLEAIKKLEAYEIIDSHEMPDLGSDGALLRHKKSGARIAIISNEDENKVFYIGFRTPVSDSTGVPHIIEHSVLCGSDKFPAKDPFVELVKGSLNTFLNAMTYADKTVYPVASCNDKDFQNLMDVYLDAVFHPNIYVHPEIFKQEGWHYELESEEEELKINGVVYNEMKGAFSSPEGVLDRVILNSLFPDTSYANESGGDPEVIPTLTYEAFLDFHKKYYHPSNSYIYLYGNMNVEEKLQWLDEAYLGHYESAPVDSEIHKQEAFPSVREVERPYHLAAEEEENNQTYLSYNLVVGTSTDEKLYAAFDILDYALLNMPGAPLKKALLDAGIGKDIMGGYDGGTYQPIFSVIAKNAEKEDKERFVEIIRETLKKQVADGIDKKALLAGLNSSEFRFREADFGTYPKGLIYGLQAFDSWLYDETKPFLHLEALGTYCFLREQIDTDYFEKLVQTYLLDNTHASLVLVVPQKGLNEKNEEALAKKLSQYKDSLTAEEKHSLVEETKALKHYQEEPTPQEDLEKIPMLSRADIKKEAEPFQNELLSWEDRTVLYHEFFTNGICYESLLFDVGDVKEEDLPYLGILKSCLGYMDTKSYSYSELANEINLYTGGIAPSMNVIPMEGKDDYRFLLGCKGKALTENISQMESLTKEILLTTKFDDEKRLKEILSETKSKMQMVLTQAGHQAASMRGLSYFSKTEYVKDRTTGIAFYDVVVRLEENFEKEKDSLIRKLQELSKKCFVRERLTVSVTCEKKDLEKVKEETQTLLLALPMGEKAAGNAAYTICKKNEGFKAPSMVQYVARTGNFLKHGLSYHGALKILKVILNYDYLWINLRVKGGAYGCMSNFLRNGDSTFVSYRDPNLAGTNEIYKGIPAYLSAFSAGERDMTKYIIGTISGLDTPLNPDAKGSRSAHAYFSGVTYEMIQKERDEILNATKEDIRRLAPLMEAVLSDDCICVIGSESEVAKEKELFMEQRSLF